MSSPGRRLLLPVVGRHLGREFLSAFGLTLGAFVGIYLVADFFDRLDILEDIPIARDMQASIVQHHTVTWWELTNTREECVGCGDEAQGHELEQGHRVQLRTQSGQNEFVALRACGVSIWQTVTPLLTVAALISVATFAWNETVVPYSARRWHQVEDRDIKKRGDAGVFTGRDVWYHGRAGFYSIDRVSLRHNALYGLTVYQLGRDFLPVRLIEADSAVWVGEGWQLEGTRTREFGPDGVRETPAVPPGFVLPETIDDFRTVSVEPEELSYAMLRRQIRDLHHKGVDASESWVDLHLKVALPAASFLMMLVAAPLAVAGTRVSSLAASIGTGLLIGFSYFVVLGFTRALGQTGALPPALAAWTANGLFALVGGYYLLDPD